MGKFQVQIRFRPQMMCNFMWQLFLSKLEPTEQAVTSIQINRR